MIWAEIVAVIQTVAVIVTLLLLAIVAAATVLRFNDLCADVHRIREILEEEEEE